MSTARALPTSISQYVDAEPPTDPVLRLGQAKDSGPALIAQMIEAARTTPDEVAEVAQKSAEIASAMAILHGGEWRVQIDHDVCFVVVRQI